MKSQLNFSAMEESSSSTNSLVSSPELEISDMETTPDLQSYTSLKDLLSDTAGNSPPPPPPLSIWNDELPIKNRLVKHAALAYLQPMLLPPSNLKNHRFGCLQWLLALSGDLSGSFRW